MRLVAYSEILEHVADAMGWDRDSDGLLLADSNEWRSAKRAISRAMTEVWTHAMWPDLLRIEKRRYQPEYDAAEAVTAGEFRFYPPTGLYYQALRASTGQEPSVETSPGAWDTNLDYWSDAERSLSADNYDATVAYEQGDQVYDPVTYAFYQVHTAGAAGTAVTDTAVWGEITELDPYVPWVRTGETSIGQVVGVYAQNPDVYRHPTPVKWTESTNGIQIRDENLNEVWVKFRLRPPRFTGDVWDATVSYSIVDDEEAPIAPVPTLDSSDLGIPGRVALRARTQHVDMEVVYLLYLVTEDDEQGGNFEFRASDTTADDGVDFLRPDDVGINDPGRWVRCSNLT